MFFSSKFAQSFLKKLSVGELPTEKEQRKFLRDRENLLLTDSGGDTALQLSIKSRDIIPLFDSQLAIKNGFNQLTAALIRAGANVNAANNNGATLLSLAAENGYTEIADMLIKAGANVNAADNFSNTTLHDAAYKGHGEIADMLMKAGANVNAVNNISSTPLHCAADKGHGEIADMLIKAGANVNATNSDGVTPLIYAAEKGYGEIAGILVKAGANVNFANNFGTTPLLWAAEKGYEAIADMLIKAGADVNVINSVGVTPLIYAANKGNGEIADMLLKAGAKVNAANNKGATPLSVAAERGYKEIADMLIKAGANVNAVNSFSRTPLHYAAENGHREIADMLIKAGADVNATNGDGVTPLIYAAEKGYTDIADVLIKAGADVNAANSNNTTPLLWAAENGYMEIADMLVKAGADVNAANRYGDTSLLYAVDKGFLTIAELLLEKGADIGKANQRGYTALAIALKNGLKNMAETLLDKNADVHAVTNAGFTPLIYAAERGYTDVVRLLLSRGADPDRRTDEGKTALSLAKKNGHTQAEKLLRAVTTSTIDMKVYKSKDWELSFLYPDDWTVLSENDVSGTWSIPVSVGGAFDAGQRPVFMVNARRDEILSPLASFVTVTQMLIDGSMVTVPHSPSEYTETSKKNLAKYFDGLRFKSVCEVRLHGGVPAAKEIYSYDSQGGRVTEMSVTAFCKGLSYQLICDMPEQKERRYIELFDAILNTVRITREPVGINWEIPDDLVTYGEGGSSQAVTDAFLAEGKQAGQAAGRDVSSDSTPSGGKKLPPVVKRTVAPLQTSSPEEAINYLFDTALPSLESIPLSSVKALYEGYETSWRSNGLFHAGSDELRGRVYPNILKTCRQPGFHRYHIDMFDHNSRLVAMAGADDGGASVCIWRADDQYYFCGNYFFESGTGVGIDQTGRGCPEMSEQEIQEAVDALVKECRWHFSNVDDYSAMESEFARREAEIIRPIGEKLNRAGGMALMRKVYERVEAECGRSCRSALDMKWGRIGDWMS